VVRRTTTISSLGPVKAIRHFGSVPSAPLIRTQLIVFNKNNDARAKDHLE
jgi:hypothetical protein